MTRPRTSKLAQCKPVRIDVYSDGSCRNVKGGQQPMGAGVHIEVDREPVHSRSYPLDTVGTSNAAEWWAFRCAAADLADLVYRRGFPEYAVTFHLDSKLVVDQYTTQAYARNPLFCDLRHQIMALLEPVRNVRIKWVPRAANSVADKLAAEARKSAIAKLHQD